MFKIKHIQKLDIFCLLIIVISYILLNQNRLWMSFVDEADNLLGGWLISKGNVLYNNFFSHHMPLPYYYASLLIKLGLNDVSGLRIGMSITILFFWLLIIALFKDKINYRILCILIFLSAIAHPLFLGHMFLADSFFAYSILIIFLYFFSKPQLNFNLIDKIIIVLMIYISIMSTLVSIFPIILLVVYYVVRKISQFSVKETNSKTKIFEELKFALILVAPFIVLLFLFYLQDSLQQFFNQAYLFNKNYYSQFTGSVIRVDIFELMKTYSEHIFFYTVNFVWLINEKSFIWEVPPWNRPLLFFEGFLVISNLIVLVIFWKKRSPYLAVFYFSFLAFLRTSGELDHGSGWFHGTPYYLLSFFGIGLVITEIYEFLKYKYRFPSKQTTNVKLTMILTMFYVFLAIIFLVTISYAYFSNGSGIGSNNAYVSPYNRIIQTLTQPEDAIWIAPLDPSLYFTNNRLPASRYAFYLPWHAASDKINQEIIDDLNFNKPPLIIFNKDIDIWGYEVKDYGKVIYNNIQQNYFQVDPDDPIYKNIYLINTKRDILLNTLLIRGLYKHKNQSY